MKLVIEHILKQDIFESYPGGTTWIHVFQKKTYHLKKSRMFSTIRYF